MQVTFTWSWIDKSLRSFVLYNEVDLVAIFPCIVSKMKVSIRRVLVWISFGVSILEGVGGVGDDRKPKRWAVLVAGSQGYGNYRHQADVCHAYQILKKGGLKDENIIVFMYDDIAYNPLNPRPGIIINKPNGPDVYRGVPKVCISFHRQLLANFRYHYFYISYILNMDL